MGGTVEDLIKYLEGFDPKTPVLIMENRTIRRAYEECVMTEFKPLDFEANEQFFAYNGTLQIGNDS